MTIHVPSSISGSTSLSVTLIWSGASGLLARHSLSGVTDISCSDAVEVEEREASESAALSGGLKGDEGIEKGDEGVEERAVNESDALSHFEGLSSLEASNSAAFNEGRKTCFVFLEEDKESEPRKSVALKRACLDFP